MRVRVCRPRVRSALQAAHLQRTYGACLSCSTPVYMLIAAESEIGEASKELGPEGANGRSSEAIARLLVWGRPWSLALLSLPLAREKNTTLIFIVDTLLSFLSGMENRVVPFVQY